MQDYIALLASVLKMASISSMEAQVNKHIECCQHGQRIQTNDFASGSAIESGYPECTHMCDQKLLTNSRRQKFNRFVLKRILIWKIL